MHTVSFAGSVPLEHHQDRIECLKMRRAKNCYLSEGYRGSTFDYMDCAGAETACTGDDIPSDKGGCLACIASSGGGYCDIDGEYYSSRGMGRKFHPLNNDDIFNISPNFISLMSIVLNFKLII